MQSKSVTCEIHFTFPYDQDEEVQRICRNLDSSTFPLKHSCIYGDPILGKEKYSYISSYASSIEQAVDRTAWIRNLLASTGMVAIREKIEIVVFDTKTGIGVEVHGS